MDFYQKIDFQSTVYKILDGQIEPIELGILAQDYAEMVCAPTGATPRYHSRGNELWDWGRDGQSPRLVQAFNNEQDANHAAQLCWLDDLHNDDHAPMWFYTETEAVEFIHA